MQRHDIERISRQVMAKNGCHSIILYGSWARGCATEASDVDLLCIRQSGPDVRDACVVDDVYIDAFIYSEATLVEPTPALLRVLGGQVLHERDGLASSFLTKLQLLHDRGPEPISDDERTAALLWSKKMQDRFRGQGGLEANFRRMQLLTQSLEDYFVLRGLWFRGPKESFSWLLQHDAATHKLFERAARPGAGDDDLAELVRIVYTALKTGSRSSTQEAG